MSYSDPSIPPQSADDRPIAVRGVVAKSPLRNLAGKVAFITGGSSGVGLGIAQACLNAGMNLTLTYRTDQHLDRALKKLGGPNDRILTIRLDVSDRTALKEAARSALHAFGKVHLLVNNAGIDPDVPLTSASFDDLDWCLEVNVKGVFNGIRTFLPHLRAHTEGAHIVTTASINGLVVGSLWGLYSVSKFAVVGMMEALRAELQDENIGVSVFCPGHLLSEIGNSKRNRPADLADRGLPDAAQRAQIDAFAKVLRTAAFSGGGALPMMDPVEAGEHVLDGVRNNDLYILSHPEYAQAVRERHEAILESFPAGMTPLPTRLSIAQFERSSIYFDALAQRRGQQFIVPEETDH